VKTPENPPSPSPSHAAAVVPSSVSVQLPAARNRDVERRESCTRGRDGCFSWSEVVERWPFPPWEPRRRRWWDFGNRVPARVVIGRREAEKEIRET